MSIATDLAIAHRPWFRPVVCLWFAVLFAAGVAGVMAVTPPHTRDVLFSNSGLATLHPIFEPPVGLAGLSTIAALGGALGMLLGLVIAAWLAGSGGDAALDEGDGKQILERERGPKAEEPVRSRVLSAREDIAEKGIAITRTSDFSEGRTNEAPQPATRLTDACVVEVEHETPEPVRTAPVDTDRRLAELTLAQLTGRLAAALQNRSRQPVMRRGPEPDMGADPLVPAPRHGDATVPAAGLKEDTQEALRSALAKLGDAGQPD